VKILVVDTPELGDRSYLIHDGTTGFVVDPQRDLDRMLTVIATAGVRLSHVFETHIHNDYLTGGLALAKATGAAYVVAGAEEVSFDRTPAGDGSAFESGRMAVQALHTPGHTVSHLSYLAQEEGRPVAVFTGGSLLYGTVGRTDLISSDLTEELARSQFRSARRLLKGLPGAVQVMPTHGFGSFCSSGGDSGLTVSDIATERLQNLASKISDEATFAATVTRGFGPYPTYYERMAPLNRRGPGPFVAVMPPLLDAEAVARRISSGGWVVDTRCRQAFAERHLAGTVAVELGNGFSTYLGWLAPAEKPVTLLTAGPQELDRAQRDLARIGIDMVASNSQATNQLLQLLPTRSYPVSTFAELGRAMAEPAVLDVRQSDEWQAGHIDRAIHMPLQEISAHLSELPPGRLWVHCQSGYRAGVAASLLDRAGRDVILIDDDFSNVSASGLTIST
jgi:glyoxylase-like metal-dependent hydrolase (beta-lactamase superfamily II)/rhodanese-related sulfurtransferase